MQIVIVSAMDSFGPLPLWSLVLYKRKQYIIPVPIVSDTISTEIKELHTSQMFSGKVMIRIC